MGTIEKLSNQEHKLCLPLCIHKQVTFLTLLEFDRTLVTLTIVFFSTIEIKGYNSFNFFHLTQVSAKCVTSHDDPSI